MNEITCGVPQGSMLGPLLFIIYVNDLNDICQNASLVLFADDTNIFFCDDNPLNLAKTNYILFNNSTCIKDKNFNIVVNGQKLQRVKKT